MSLAYLRLMFFCFKGVRQTINIYHSKEYLRQLLEFIIKASLA